MKTLKDLDCRKTAPVDRVNVPYADGAHDTADTVAEESNRDGAEDDCDRAQRHVVEQVRCSEDLTGGSSNRCGGCGDGCDGMLFQVPFAMVEEGHDCNPHRRLANSALFPPPSLELVAAG